MPRFVLRVLSKVLIVASLCFVAAPAKAQIGAVSGNIGPDHLGLAVGAAAAVIGVGIGVAVYFIVRQPRVTGCVSSSPDGSLTLQGKNAGDPVYVLQGATGTLTAGSRVKVVGKRKKDTNKQQLLVVSRVAKTYGACSPPPAHALHVVPPDRSTFVPDVTPGIGMQFAEVR